LAYAGASLRRHAPRHGGARSEPDADVQATPEDAFVPLRLAELVVVGREETHRDVLDQIEPEADLGADHDAVLDARAVDAAGIDGEDLPHDTQILREPDRGNVTIVSAVVLSVEAPQQALLERHGAVKAGQNAEDQLRANEIVLAAVVRLAEVVPVHGADREREPIRFLGRRRRLDLDRRGFGHRRRGRRLGHDDLDPAVARLGDAVRGRDEQIVLAAADGGDGRRRHALADQFVRHHLGALLRERPVELRRTDRVGVADHVDLGRPRLLELLRSTRDRLDSLEAEFRFAGVEVDHEPPRLDLAGHGGRAWLRGLLRVGRWCEQRSQREADEKFPHRGSSLQNYASRRVKYHRRRARPGSCRHGAPTVALGSQSFMTDSCVVLPRTNVEYHQCPGWKLRATPPLGCRIGAARAPWPWAGPAARVAPAPDSGRTWRCNCPGSAIRRFIWRSPARAC